MITNALGYLQFLILRTGSETVSFFTLTTQIESYDFQLD